MLQFVGFVVAVFVIVTVNGDEHVELIKEIKASCIEETGITLQGVDQARDGDFSDPKIADFAHCFMKMGDFLDENGKYRDDKIIEKVIALFGDDVANTIKKECMKEEHGAGKEASLNFFKCFQQHGPEHDL